MTAKVWDRVVGPEAIDQVNQRNQFAVTALVTANVDTVVVIKDVLQGCRGVLLVWLGHGML